jgi:hypothetical protein
MKGSAIILIIISLISYSTSQGFGTIQATSLQQSFSVPQSYWFNQDQCAEPKILSDYSLNTSISFGDCPPTDFTAPIDYDDCENQDTLFSFVGTLGSTTSDLLPLGYFEYLKRNNSQGCSITGGMMSIKLQINNEVGLDPNGGLLIFPFELSWGPISDYVQFDFSDETNGPVPYMVFVLSNGAVNTLIHIHLQLFSDPLGVNMIINNDFVAPANRVTRVYLFGIVQMAVGPNFACTTFSVGDVSKTRKEIMEYTVSVQVPQNVTDDQVCCRICANLEKGTYVQVRGIPQSLPAMMSSSSKCKSTQCLNYEFVSTNDTIPVTFLLENRANVFLFDAASIFIESLYIKCTGQICFLP